MLDRNDALLLVVDIQDKLMPREESVIGPFLRNGVKLIETARTLGIPVLITEQNPERLGGTNTQVAEALRGLPRIAKLEFSCVANGEFESALRQSNRSQCIVIGMETHICVMQTALGLKEAGLQPFIVQDACLSARKVEHQAGLARLAHEGVTLVTTQMAMFELLRAAGTPEFKQMLRLLKPDD